MTVWIDIDKPTKTFSIHSQNNSRNPKYKGINQMLRDGGEFEKESYKAAITHKSQYSDYKLNDKFK